MWPGRWRGGGALRRAVREVRTALVVEEEDGAPLRRGYGDGGGKIDELVCAGDVEFRPIFTSSSSSSSASSPSMTSPSSSADSPAAERTSDDGGGHANEKVEEEVLVKLDKVLHPLL